MNQQPMSAFVLDCIRKFFPTGKVIIPLYSAPVEGKSEMLCSVPGSIVQEKCGLGMSPGKAMKKIKGLKNWPC